MSRDAGSFEEAAPPRPGADGEHHTYCRLCEALCGLVATVEHGRIAHVGPDREHPVSAGHLCVKGPGMVRVVYDPDRVVRPLKRVGAPGVFEPVTWDEALDDIASRLERIVDRDGGESLGLYLGNPASFSTLHGAYVIGFLRAFGGCKAFNSMHVDTGAKMLACEFVYGGAMRFTFPDIERCDFLLMLGANPMVTHMSLIAAPRAAQQLKAIARRGAVVVVDPRRTETAERFEHLFIKPDSDVWLLAGLIATLFREGLIVEDGLDAKIEGWRSLKDAVLSLPIDVASARCGVDVGAIQHLARRFAAARTAACYGRCGTNRGTFSTLTNVLVEALNILTGRFAQAGGWVFGQSPLGDLGRAHTASQEKQRSRIGSLPIVVGFTPGGTMAAEMTTPGKGQLRAFFLDSGNPVLSYPQGDVMAEALDQLELFVALDLYITESSRYADYILPATTFFERADVTDFWVTHAPHPWIQYTDAVIPPVGESRNEFEVYEAILARLHRPNPLAGLTRSSADGVGPIEAAEALLRASPLGDGFGARPEGLNFTKLRSKFPSGVCTADSVDAAASWGRISHPDGRLRLWNESIAREVNRLRATLAERPTDELKLFGRRKLRSMNSWMHNIPPLVRSDAPTLLMHPADARERQIRSGETVRIRSRVASLDVVVEVSDEVMQGSVCYPHGWGHTGEWRHAATLAGVNINLLASADPQDCEQVSGMILLDGIPVSVSRF